jgi:hypothetical protein
MRSTELGERVAAALGVRPTTTATHVRNLREAGFLTKAGRGITGAHMTPADAAKVLIATNCSQDVKDSVISVERYGSLPLQDRPWNSEFFPTLGALGEAHKFLDVLTALLSEETILFLAEDGASTLSVVCKYPRAEVYIEVSSHGTVGERNYLTQWSPKMRPVVPAGDREISYKFTEQTVFAVGNALRSER